MACTKQDDSVWFECRKRAAMYNDKLNSREGAAELIGVSPSSLADYELGVTKVVPVDKAVLMSDERNLLNNKFFINAFSEELPKTIAPLYELKNTERKMLGWLYEKDHPEGILCKPCPVCGYEYGSSWKYFPIPEEDEKIILHLLKTGEVPA